MDMAAFYLDHGSICGTHKAKACLEGFQLDLDDRGLKLNTPKCEHPQTLAFLRPSHGSSSSTDHPPRQMFLLVGSCLWTFGILLSRTRKKLDRAQSLMSQIVPRAHTGIFSVPHHDHTHHTTTTPHTPTDV